ncbi:MAG TPA: PKD domain-containing protein, partial [Bacteroidales bacterium]|nr:PKD domain-containing protein [Bacteroidales bacterium]
PAANFEASETTLLVGESTNFTDLSSGEPTSWEWTFEGGDPATFSGQNPPAVTYDSEGTFDVTLVVSNDVGENTLVREDYIVVGYAPEADFEATPLTLLEGQSVTFTDMSTNNPESWSWTFNGGVPAASSAQNPVVTYNDFGVYDVTLEVTNQFGADSETKIEYIIVNGVGIEQLSLEEEKLIVYPNPASDIINVVTLPNTEAQVRILSAVGKQVLAKQITDEKTTLNVGNLPSGIYIVEMIDTANGQRITKRLIVK